MPLTATISHISRASIHDGPGVRTVVYFKGCGLRCRWCHNPETFSATPDILFAKIKCIHCGKCIEFCPAHHVIEGEDMVFVRNGCLHCGRCADVCPSGALSLSGKQMTIDEVMHEVRKDMQYYRQSGGGITLSGGECLLQSEFCAALLEQCKKEGIHTAIESALFVPRENVERVLPYCDFIFADCKVVDDSKHRQYTGQSNRLILQNLQKSVASAPGRVTVRIPLIPSVNDSSRDIADFASQFQPYADQLAGIEILRYNTLAESKYRQSGQEYTDFGPAQTDDCLLNCCASLEQQLAHKTKVFTVL